MDTIALWIAALAVPAVVIVAYWLVARRQVTSGIDEVRTQLDAEQELTARISHQVRDPLTVIYGFSEALLDSDLDDTAEVRGVLEIINAEALTVSRTVDNLVVANQVKDDDLVVRSIVFQPAVELERAVRPFRRLGAAIDLECPDIQGRSDPVLFRQVIQNLVSNAVRHGGSEVSIVALAGPKAFECTVADDGSGLPLGATQELFASEVSERPVDGSAPPSGSKTVDADASETAVEPAVAVEDEAEITSRDRGDGHLLIGLPVAKALAVALGGDLTYSRSEGVSMFTLALPTEDWPEPTRPDTPPDTTEDAAAAVDDDDDEPATEEGTAGGVPAAEPRVIVRGGTISFDDVDDGGDEHDEHDEDDEDDEHAEAATGAGSGDPS